MASSKPLEHGIARLNPTLANKDLSSVLMNTLCLLRQEMKARCSL